MARLNQLGSVLHSREPSALALTTVVRFSRAGQVLTGAALLCTASAFSQSADNPSACLYSVAVAGREVTVCTADILNVRDDPRVKQAIAFFGLASTKITFKGCKGAFFHVNEEFGAEGYVVTYPVEARENYLAPITHELAHIIQMKSAGGWSVLSHELSSRRIELGADFLAGIAFRRVFRDISLNEFQQNLQLTGAYGEREPDPRAHGTPEQRVNSFRLGIFSQKVKDDLLAAHQYFQDDEYAWIVNS